MWTVVVPPGQKPTLPVKKKPRSAHPPTTRRFAPRHIALFDSALHGPRTRFHTLLRKRTDGVCGRRYSRHLPPGSLHIRSGTSELANRKAVAVNNKGANHKYWHHSADCRDPDSHRRPADLAAHAKLGLWSSGIAGVVLVVGILAAICPLEVHPRLDDMPQPIKPPGPGLHLFEGLRPLG